MASFSSISDEIRWAGSSCGVCFSGQTGRRVVVVGFKMGDELLTCARLHEVMLGQQEAKGVSGHQLEVGLFSV